METSTKKFSKKLSAVRRRKTVIIARTKQLKTGKKPVYDKQTKETTYVDLSESDIIRIEKEIEILKSRI